MDQVAPWPQRKCISTTREMKGVCFGHYVPDRHLLTEYLLCVCQIWDKRLECLGERVLDAPPRDILELYSSLGSHPELRSHGKSRGKWGVPSAFTWGAVSPIAIACMTTLKMPTCSSMTQTRTDSLETGFSETACLRGGGDKCCLSLWGLSRGAIWSECTLLVRAGILGTPHLHKEEVQVVLGMTL